MSIPIPIILALLAQKKSGTNVINQDNSAALVPAKENTVQISRVQRNKDVAKKLNGFAQIMGGTRGAKLSSAANIITSVNSINNPINLLSLAAKSRMNSPVSNLLSGSNMPAMNGASNIYSNINNMLSSMDKDKKDELLSMAESIMKSSK